MALPQGRILFLGLTLLLASFSAASQTTGCDEPMLMMSGTSSAGTSSFPCEDDSVPQPGPISSISVSPSTSSTGSFTVSWSAASNMVSSGINAWGYKLKEYKNGILVQTLNLSPTSTTYNATGRANGSYYYQVTGCNQKQGVAYCGSTSSSSNTVTVNISVGTPTSISGPTAVDIDGAYTISWGASSTPSVTYKLEERFKPRGSTTYQSWTQIYSGTGLSKAVSGRADGEWDYRVRACNGTPCSAYRTISTKVTVLKKPSVPANVAVPASSANGSYTLSWSASSGVVDRYEYSESPGFSPWVSAGTSTSKAFSGRLDGSWSYRVRACNTSGCSSYATSNTVTVLHPTPPAPSQVTAPVETSQSTYQVSWTASTSSYADSYQISNRHESGTWSAWANASGTSTNVTVDQSGNWTHRVVACNTLPGGTKKCSDTPRVSNSVHAQLPAPWAQTGGNVADDFYGAVSGLSHDPEVGAVQGEPGVSGGAATYHLPIAVPPGRNGMTPSVALTYSSRSGNGIAGVGWGLSATSSIHRCSATPAQDGYRLAATLKVSDKLCLDGKRLMLVSGTYGQSGAIYRTELDSFAKVTQTGSLNSLSSFTVQYPNNKTGYFGTTTDSRHIPSGSAIIANWAIAREQDASGNTIDYRYITPVAGEHLLNEILYTGYNSTSGTRRVSFFYESRPDTSRSWLGGGLSQSTRRLKSIETSLSGSPVREYTLNYSLSAHTSRSLLTSVTECADSYCLPATQFYPHNVPMTWQPTDSSSSSNRALTPTGNTVGLDRVKQKDLTVMAYLKPYICTPSSTQMTR